MVFKIVVSDPKKRKAYQKETEEGASGLIGKKIGEKISGSFLGLEGYELEITGGSDNEGFPMRRDVEGQGRKKLVLAFPPGFHAVRKGERKRKSIRGNTISKDISQINVKVVKEGSKPLDALLGAKEKKAEGEAPKEGEKKEAPKAEEKPAAEKAEAPAKEEKPEAEKAEKPAEEKPEAPKEEKKESPKEGAKANEKPTETKEDAKPEEAKAAEGKMGVKSLEEQEAKAEKEAEEGKPEEGKKPGEKKEEEK